jgi:hypothetical protein
VYLDVQQSCKRFLYFHALSYRLFTLNILNQQNLNIMEVINQPNEMSVKDWLVTLILTAIPVVGFIMLFVWAFGESTPTAKANWAKAALLLFAIGIVLWFVFAILFAGVFVAANA